MTNSSSTTPKPPTTLNEGWTHLLEASPHDEVGHARTAGFALTPVVAAHCPQQLRHDSVEVLRYRRFGVANLTTTITITNNITITTTTIRDSPTDHHIKTTTLPGTVQLQVNPRPHATSMHNTLYHRQTATTAATDTHNASHTTMQPPHSPPIDEAPARATRRTSTFHSRDIDSCTRGMGSYWYRYSLGMRSTRCASTSLRALDRSNASNASPDPLRECHREWWLDSARKR